MNPSIMKLLEEDEDETMHSGLDLEAFTAALNGDIEGDSSTSQPSKSDSGGSYITKTNIPLAKLQGNPPRLALLPLSQGGSCSLNQFAPWQTSSNEENATHKSPQHSQNMQQKEGNSSDIELKQRGTSNLAADSNAKKLHEVKNQAIFHGTPGNQVSSSSLIAVKQESDRSAFPVQGLNKQHQQHLHFPQASFPNFANIGNNYTPCSVTNLSSSMERPLKQQSNDLKMRQIPGHPNRNAAALGASTQAMNMICAPKLERQNSFGEPKRIPGGSLSHVSNTSIMQQSSVQWPRSTNKAQKSLLLTPMTNLKPKPMDHLHEQQHKSQLPPLLSVPVEQGNSSSESSKDETFEVQTSRMGISTSASNKPSNVLSSSVASQMDTLLISRTPPMTSSIGPGNNGKIPLKKPTIGKKKPLDTQGFSSPPSGKKQKVSGAFVDQSIEQLNDVTAVSGVNLRQEEEQLFSGPREDSRVSEASRRAVLEEEERLILQKNPLQRKLNGIMAKCGLKNMSSDVERCISLSVEDRMRGLISSLIRISKQRISIEKSKHRTVVTSDVRKQIMALNRKVRGEWENQAEAEKLQKANELEGTVGDDGDKEKDEGCIKSVKVNKEEDDKMRKTAANVAARAAVGGDDMLSKWQLMAEQARQKREGGLDVASLSQPGKDVNRRSLSTPTRNLRDHQEALKRIQSTSSIPPGAVRRVGRNQVPRCITVKDVIAVLESEPQMSKSTVIYRLYEKIRCDAPAELS